MLILKYAVNRDDLYLVTELQKAEVDDVRSLDFLQLQNNENYVFSAVF